MNSRNLRLERTPDGLAMLTFDRPDSSANIFDLETMDGLAAALDALRADPPRALMLVSAKPRIFVAGADIQAFAAVTDGDAARALSARGQEVFNRLADLPFPTVAAIHGQALGGGCEVALACDWRIASDTRETRIGLPEIQLGILPAWGGCHRLPRLVGLPAALDVILAGKTLSAYSAKKTGLVDRLVPREHFARLALELAANGKRPAPSFRFTDLAPVRAVVAARARKLTRVRTHGHYPAPPRALEVILGGFGRPREAALRLEREALAELMPTPECRNLTRVFLLQERAKKLRVEDAPAGKPAPVSRMAVIGAGVMGAGIAQYHAGRGTAVLLRDISPEAVNAGLKRIHGLFEEAAKRRVLNRAEARQACERVTPLTGDARLPRVDLVVEAAPEKLELKRAVFAALDRGAPPDALLATNTSALSIDAIAGAVADPGRVVGIHYFNPVHKMQLVEVVRGARTSPGVVARAVAFVQAAGKLPVVVRDRPGFLVNRVLLPSLVEAGLLFEQGVSVDAIDRAMLDFGMPMGPLRLLDEVGADVGLHVAKFLAESFPDRMQVPDVLARMVEAGALGRKTGAGFYLHAGSGKEGPPRVNPAAVGWVKGAASAALSPAELRDRMVLPLLNECARCLEEGVAAAAADVDLALVFGAGFAPFRGGPLRHADAVGLPELVRRMDALGGRFAPCALLRRLAAEGGAFYAPDQG